MTEAHPASSAAVSIRVRHVSRSRYDGQRRHDCRIGPQPQYVDDVRTGDNRVVIEPPRPVEMRDRADERRKRGGAVRAMRNDAAIATCGIVTFGAAAQPIFEQLDPAAQNAAYLAVAEKIAEEHGTTVCGLVVHSDEAAPHAHVVWDARSGDGAAMSKLMRGSRLQDIAAEVMSQHAPGIVRGKRKADRIEQGDDASAIYHRSVRELHHDLPHELEELRADRDAASARLEKNERLAEKAREKAQGDDTKAAKARRRAESYEKRAADAQTEIARLDARSDALSTRETGLDEREAALNHERNRLRRVAADLTAAQTAAKEILGDLRQMRDLPRDLRNGLRDGLRDLRDALQPPKKTERERINDQIHSQSVNPDKSNRGLSGPE